MAEIHGRFERYGLGMSCSQAPFCIPSCCCTAIYKKYIAGGALGVLLSSCGIGGLGILVGLGFYLPFHVVITYSIGMCIRIVVDNRGRKVVRKCGDTTLSRQVRADKSD